MNTYQYELYYPANYKDDPEKKWPLILFLHGAGERGSRLELLKRQGLPKLLDQRKDFPFVVAYPQCAAGSYWRVPALNEWLKDVLQELDGADPERVYLTGISMGGYGTWQWAAEEPAKFAAIIPVCGGGDPARAKQLLQMPVWAFHGAKDDIVPLSETLAMVNAVEEAGGKVKLTIYPDLFHDSWTVTYQNPLIYDWLLEHRKSS